MMTPYRVVSLWEMFELPIGRLIHTYQKMASTCQFLATWSARSAPPSFANNSYKDVMPLFTDGDYNELREYADEFSRLCLEVSLVVTHNAAKVVCADIRRATKDGQTGGWIMDTSARMRLSGSLKTLIECLSHESSTKTAMILPPEKLSLFAPSTPLFGIDVRAKFPDATFDIDEAAKCLALGRSTAAVFHLMRVVEVLLIAISRCLGLSKPKNPNWGTWIGPIRDECARRTSKWTEFNLFQDYWQRIDSIKDAQRNQTMHVENVYTEDEAVLIFRATEGFMKKVASRMDESGLPLA